VAWDAVAKIAETDTVKYQLYARLSDPSATAQKVGPELTATQGVLSFVAEGRYYVGVESIRYPEGETVGLPSETISWSSDPVVCSPAGPFGIAYYIAPPAPVGLKRVQ
jgi:hypothetical protein